MEFISVISMWDNVVIGTSSLTCSCLTAFATASCLETGLYLILPYLINVFVCLFVHFCLYLELVFSCFWSCLHQMHFFLQLYVTSSYSSVCTFFGGTLWDQEKVHFNWDNGCDEYFNFFSANCNFVSLLRGRVITKRGTKKGF